MRRFTSILLMLVLILSLASCGDKSPAPSTSPDSTPTVQPISQPTDQPNDDPIDEPDPTDPEEGQGDFFDEVIPDGAEVLRPSVYFYQLVEKSGDFGDGLSPLEGAFLADDLIADIGFYANNGGIPVGKCVYISLDELSILDSAMNRECYIYSVAIGTPEGGLMGDNYQVIYRISVDYSGKKTAAIYEDFSSDYSYDGRGDVIPDDGRGDVIPDTP